MESMGAQPEMEVQANTTGSMKVIITKQDEEGQNTVMVDESAGDGTGSGSTPAPAAGGKAGKGGGKKG